MKVLYDISLLANQYKTNRLRTGIFRVVENLAENLILERDCNLKLCSIVDDLEAMFECLNYLKTNSNLSTAPFILPPFSKQKQIVSSKINKLISVRNSTRLNVVNSLSNKLELKRLWLQAKLYNKIYNSNIIHPRQFSRSDIYHSPIYAIPKEVSKSKIKSIFLTSYDLIAVLHPEYFEPATIAFVKSVLDSITRDTWVLCISMATRNDLLNYLGTKLNPARVWVTELAASDTFYESTDKERNLEVRRKYRIPEGPYILSLCTLEPRKNIDSVIRAFALIVAEENVVDLNLVLGGSKGWMFDKVFDEIEGSKAIKDRIIITGYIQDEDLASIYTDALFFVYPSFYEGFGLPPLEAMKCGTPVITSNTSSLPEVVGEAGIMVDPRDLDALCNSMLSVYKTPSLRNKLSQQSLRRAADFSWERCAKETVEVYRRSLDA